MARLLYFLRRAGLHLRRSPAVAGITVGTVAIVFLVLGAFGLLGHNLDRLADRLRAGLQLVVYLEDDITPDQRSALQRRLERSDLVAGLDHVSRAQALTRFRRELGPQATLLAGIEQNPLPASLEASLSGRSRSARQVAELAQQVVGAPGVVEVQYGQAWLDRFFDFLGLARWAGLGIGTLIVFATLMIVSNTIRLSVFARRDEVHILKLVGATDRFVKAPFYIEGVVLGLGGAASGVAGTWLLFALVAPRVEIPLGPRAGALGLEFLPLPVVVLMVGGGALLGLLGTLTGLWRHLRI